MASRESGLDYDQLVSGQTIYGYVNGNPISYVDPDGLSRANPFDPNRFGGGAGGGGGGRICPPVSKGARTEPTLPPKTVVNENGVTVQHYTKSGDHAPAHLHVKGGGPETKIGQNGHPIKGSPEPTPTQQSVIDANKSEIRRAVEKMQRWFDFMRNN